MPLLPADTVSFTFDEVKAVLSLIQVLQPDARKRHMAICEGGFGPLLDALEAVAKEAGRVEHLRWMIDRDTEEWRSG